MTEKRRAVGPQKKGKKQTKAKASENKKEKHLREKIRTAEKEIEILKDQLFRTAAELDNFRKRTEREISNIVRNANEKIIKDILSIIDDFERSLKSAPKRGKGRDFCKGFELIYQKLMTILRGYGLEPMESIGKDFDVEQHDALLQVEREDIPSGVIIEEHEKGYLLNDKVVRHAKVIVNK